MKTCTTCGEERPATREFFALAKRGLFGLASRCKTCSAIYHAAYYAANRERLLVAGRAAYRTNHEAWRPKVRNAEYREQRRVQAEARRERNPLQQPAQNLLYHAVKKGLVRPQPCEECGGSQNIHGHHDDYSQPLEVSWLCAAHHSQLHSELRRAAASPPNKHGRPLLERSSAHTVTA